MIFYDPYSLYVSVIAALVGLCVGSLCNVVTYRLPIIKGLGGYADGKKLKTLIEEHGHFSLAVPGSACPSCQAPIKPWFNIPLFGWLALGGRCFSCRTKIPSSYLMIELVFGVIFFAIAFTDGISPASITRFVMVGFVYCASRIYRDTKVLYRPYLYAAAFLFILQIVLGGLGYAYTP